MKLRKTKGHRSRMIWMIL